MNASTFTARVVASTGSDAAEVHGDVTVFKRGVNHADRAGAYR